VKCSLSSFSHVKVSSVFLFLLFVVLSLKYDIGAIAPDGKLYDGIGAEFFRTGRFIDNVRHQEVLPSLGHPFLHGVLKLVLPSTHLVTQLISATAMGLTGWAVLIFTRNPLAAAVTMTSYFWLTTGEYGVAGIEPTIALFYAATAVAFFHASSKDWTPRSLVILSTVVALNILVRPTAGFLVVATTGLAFILFWKRDFRRGSALMILPFILVVVAAYSLASHDDLRMVSGTYGAIPMYAAFNPYIDLERNYSSTLWSEVADPQRTEALAMFENDAGWKVREERLRSAAWEFIQAEPRASFDGFLFRFGRYGWNAERVWLKYLGVIFNSVGLIAVLAWLKGIWLPHTLASAVVFVAMTVMQSLFVYAGPRYLAGHIVLEVVLLPLVIHEVYSKTKGPSGQKSCLEVSE